MTLVAERRTLYAFDRFTVDREDERLFDTHGPVRLGNKAFQVLLKLIDQRGRLVTKDLLMSTVWDGTIVSESALTSVIKELRRALGDDARRPRCIESVYGRGYRLLCGVADADAPVAAPEEPRYRDHAPLYRSAPPADQAPAAPSPAMLAIATPQRSLAVGRRVAQRAMAAFLFTSLLAMVPTGLTLGSQRGGVTWAATCDGCTA